MLLYLLKVQKLSLQIVKKSVGEKFTHVEGNKNIENIVPVFFEELEKVIGGM